MSSTRELRKKFKLTKKELSELLEIPFGTIKGWERRNTMPEYVLKLIKYYLEHERIDQ